MKLKIILAAIVLSLTLNSCMTTKTQVGEYSSMPGMAKKYSKAKQIWLFEGLVPIGRTSVNTPSDGNCEIVEKFTFGDVLISGLTAGIITTRTIKVKVKK